MRWIPLLLLTTAALQAEEAALDQSRVTMSYGELRQLLEAAQKPAPPAPPLDAAFLSADYDLALDKTSAQGSASFQLQTFRDGPCLVPLLGTAAKVERIDPPDAVLVQKGGKYAILIDGKARLKVTLYFSLPLAPVDAAWQADLGIPASALSALRLRNIAPGDKVTVDNASPLAAEGTESRWQLGAISSLKISRQEKPKIVAPAVDLPRTRVETPAIVRQATNETRIVRDGSYINTSCWTVRHDGALNWTLTLPEKSQLLSCQIDGQPAAPLLKDPSTLVIPLPAAKRDGETKIELTYTGRKAAFDPVRGEFAIELPATPLLVETLTWQLELPRPYETVAIQGNVDFQPAQKPGQLQLTRELARGDAPAVHVFYQKPETNPTK